MRARKADAVCSVANSGRAYHGRSDNGRVGKLGVNMRPQNLVVEQLAQPDGSLVGRLFGAEPGGDPPFDLLVFRVCDSVAV
ncbi:hypothetical protein E3T39_11250 [Cryobacterium suzukii]|uniref:Uncharacterized protein n=1 Tax=Cryobacterium suzukii TaxID=1259198 RepID=A0A4R9AEH9_9MICO|nr:hypothetical protein [Cryobacterium suzukii]TFD58935.1 hypothetical protein E3T39_11250 [Cryobacterium suzukii]